KQAPDRTHFLDLLELKLKLFQGELLLLKGFLQAHRFFFFDVLLNFVDQRQDISHPEDSGRQAVGIEGLERIELLTDAGKKNRLAYHFADRKSRPSARVSVQLGENNPRETEFAVKSNGLIDGVLTGHGIGHKQNLMRVDGAFDR